jgi:hypothetical protein
MQKKGSNLFVFAIYEHHERQRMTYLQRKYLENVFTYLTLFYLFNIKKEGEGTSWSEVLQRDPHYIIIMARACSSYDFVVNFDVIVSNYLF